ncbi:hypothetical protein [Desulfotomaculum copahuensis]|uniref:hypothetical protein n=1 Tax=Desulfotomaculum copahuensis TaxID=1838280 RepID=UPI001247BCE3|nr:hypothetical protein [Desulfotomaculum copahuensis]
MDAGNRADGAIARRPDRQWVTPYFANLAALAMLEEPAAHPLVERYLDWYLRHLRNDGAIPDHHYDHSMNLIKITRPDSEDAYAGTYLSLAARYRQKTGQTGWVRENLSGLKKVARVITGLMDKDGLTFALADYRVKYLMDNCEAYRGLADFAALLQALGDREAGYFKERAAAIAGGIESRLWNRRHACYHPAKTGRFGTKIDLKNFYPDAASQAFPALYGLTGPDSDRGAGLYALFNRHQPDWATIQPPGYPWTLLALYAAQHGDYERALAKLRHVREAYIIPQSEEWYCAEAAFFVLTCSQLLNKDNHRPKGPVLREFCQSRRAGRSLLIKHDQRPF